jgi:hypothetical protein
VELGHPTDAEFPLPTAGASSYGSGQQRTGHHEHSRRPTWAILMMVALAAVAIVAVRPPRNRFSAAGWALVVNAIRQDDLVAPVEGRLHWARSSAARTPRLLSALLAPPSGVTPHSIVAAAIAAVAQFLE